jgi:hypothetical protein
MFYSEADIIKEVFTPTIRLRLLKDSIIHYTYLMNAELDLEQAKLNHDVYLKFATGKHALIIDSLDGFVSLSKEYTDYIKSKESTTPLIGRAFVTNSLAHKLIISIHYKVNDSMYPVKVFKSYDEAVKWLLLLANQEK